MGLLDVSKSGGGPMGLKRNNELHIRLTNEEKKILINYAKANKISLNMALVTLINNLERCDKNDWGDLERYWRLWGQVPSK